MNVVYFCGTLFLFQIAYCSDNPNHLPKTHQRWCKSYSLYQKLVTYQQTSGRLEPKLPGKVMTEAYQIPEKMNEILATMYEERIGRYYKMSILIEVETNTKE